MFRDAKAFSGFAVDDTDRARAFYGETLGVQVDDLEGGLLQLTLGTGAKVLVYPKPDHTPATFTVLNFPADDVDAAVDALAARGVAFERYPEMGTDEKGVMRGHGPDDRVVPRPCRQHPVGRRVRRVGGRPRDPSRAVAIRLACRRSSPSPPTGRRRAARSRPA